MNSEESRSRLKDLVWYLNATVPGGIAGYGLFLKSEVPVFRMGHAWVVATIVGTCFVYLIDMYADPINENAIFLACVKRLARLVKFQLVGFALGLLLFTILNL